MRKFIILSVLAFIASVSYATTYSVTKAGSDSNPCTVASPCLTIVHGITKAIVAGDILTVGTGTYNESPASGHAGTSGNLITVTGSVSGVCPTTTISDVNSPTGTRPNPAVIVNGSFSINHSFYKVDCLHLITTGGGGVDIAHNLTGGVVTNLYMDGNGCTSCGGAIYMDGVATVTSGNYSSNFTIQNNYMQQLSSFFYGACSGCLISQNEAFNLQGDETGTDFSDHDYMDIWGINTTIRHNYFHGNTCNSCLGKDCHMDGVQSYNTTGDGTEVSQGIVIDRNVFFNHHEGLIMQDNSGNGDISNWTVTNNVFAFAPYDDGSGHLCQAGVVHPWCWIFEEGAIGTSNSFLNNTCYAGTMGFRNSTPVHAIAAVFKDNIWLGSGSNTSQYDLSGGSNTDTGANNLYYAPSGTFGGGQFTGDIINQNPNIISLGSTAAQDICTGCNFNIQTSSPAKNAGVSTSPTVTIDLLGTTRPQGPAYDIGAYEFIVGTPAPTLTITSTPVQTGFKGIGLNIAQDPYDQLQVLKSLCTLDCGFEPAANSHLIQLSGLNAGSTTYFNSFTQFASYPANIASGNGGGTVATVDLYRWNSTPGTPVCSTTVISNNPGTSAPVTLTISGGGLATATPSGATIDGIPNGTYIVILLGGTGSGGKVSVTITGATLGGTGYTGGVASAAAVVTAGSYTVVPATQLLTGFTTTSCGASGGYGAAGDYAIVRWKTPNTPQGGWGNLGWFISGSGTLTGETSDLCTSCNQPAGSANTQAADVNATAGPIIIQQIIDQGHQGGQNQVKMTGPYTFKFDAKMIVGSSLTWSVARGGTATYCSGTVAATASWTTVTATTSCSPNETSSTPTGSITLAIGVASGNHALVDNVTFIGPDTNPTEFADKFVMMLQNESGPFRVLDNNQETEPTTTILQPTLTGENPYQYGEFSSCVSMAWPCAKSPVITLPQALKLAVYLNKDLWYAIPATTTPSEMVILQDFLGGTCGTTGGAIRCAQTQGSTTWLSSMNGHIVHIEGGNENWNCFSGTGNKWCFVQALGGNEYAPYGVFFQAGFVAAKALPSYSSSQMDFILGMQNVGTFPSDALFTPSTGVALATDTIALGPYNGSGPTAGGFSLPAVSGGSDPTIQQQASLAEAYADANVATSKLYIMAHAGYAQKIAVYEYGPGDTTSPATGQPSQLQLNGWQNSLGQAEVDGTEALENFQHLNIALHNRFSALNFSQTFNNGSTNVVNDIWGSCLSPSGNVNANCRPAYYEFQMINQCAQIGSTLTTATWANNPTIAFTGVNNVPSIAALPQLYAYPFTNGSHNCLIVKNNSGTAQTIALSGSPLSGTITKTILTSAAPTDNNESTLVVAPVVSSVTMPTSYVTPAWSTTTFQTPSVSVGSPYITSGRVVSLGNNVSK